jgi:shikimate kinase
MTKGDRPVIVIVGPKHSGKTSAGKALARLWEGNGMSRANFIDLDELVESRAGKSPRLLYQEGPEVFRRAEAEALRSLFDGNPGNKDGKDQTVKDQATKDETAKDRTAIVAAGGGLADNPEALEILEKTRPALVVYLEVSAETAWERIRAAADKTGELPPFLNTENPRETHRKLHERRGMIYGKLAAITVKAENTPEETAAEILRRFTNTPADPANRPHSPELACSTRAGHNVP